MGVPPDGYPGIPRWVKITGIIVLVLVLGFLGAKALGIGGQHGPGMHRSPVDHQAPTSPTGHAPTTSDHGENSAVAADAMRIDVTADNLAFEPNEIRINGGRNVAIALTSVDARHDFTIGELDAHVSADAGETATGGFHAGRPGTYTFYCSEPGHREAGMEGTLVIEGFHHG